MPLDKNFNRRQMDSIIVKNTGAPLKLEFINEVRINKSAVEKKMRFGNQPSHSQETQPSSMASKGYYVHGSYYTIWR